MNIFSLGSLIKALCLVLALAMGHGGPWAQMASPVSDERKKATEPGVKFMDVTGELGIHFKHEASPTSQKYLIETMGSGVALFDCDNEGRVDAVVPATMDPFTYCPTRLEL